MTREELLQKIDYEECRRDDEELVSFIPVELLHKYWERFGGVFFQREDSAGREIEIVYRNNHYLCKSVNIYINELSVSQINKIIKTGLEIGIDLFTSVTQKAVPIVWRADIKQVID